MKNQNKYTQFVLFFALCAIPQGYAAKSSSLAPAPGSKEQFKSIIHDFEECRHEALEQVKKKSISAAEFKNKIKTCEEKYPSVSLYIECKKKTLKDSKLEKGTAASTKALLHECKSLFKGAVFNKTASLPFFIHEGKLYFAGVGLNESQSVGELNMPHYDCEKLKEVVHNPKNAEYFLFGNHPKMFAGFKSKSTKALLHTLQIKGVPDTNGLYIEGLGRFFGDMGKSNASVFFPTASCSFKEDTGEAINGMTIYYLLDKQSQKVTPYFGIVFYKPSQQDLTSAAISEQVLASINKENADKKAFKAINSGDKTTFFTQAPIKSYDEEGDPFDLCSSPRDHTYLGILRNRRDNPTYPDVLLFGNIKNLCSFGDTVTERFTK